LGVDELSVTPSSVPAIKFLLRRLRMPEAVAAAQAALNAESAEEALKISTALARKAAPELFPAG